MNLILHLIRKDLRQFRFAALFWAALIAGQLLCLNLLSSANAADLNWYNVASMFTNLLYFLGMVVAYLMAGIIVLADSPAGSAAFWQTRPISGGRLLLAKAVVVFLFFSVLPIALWLPWWIYNGFSVQGLVFGMASVFALNVIPALFGSALAVVVDQIGRFMLLTMILMAALVVFALTSLVPQKIEPTVFGSRLLLDLAVGLGTALLAIIVQYRTRRAVKSTVVLVTGVAVILMIRAWWPVDLIVWWKDNVYSPAPVADTITGQVYHVRSGSHLNKDGFEEPYVWLGLEIQGVPDDEFVASGLVDVELSWPDGTSVRREKMPLWAGDYARQNHILTQALGFPYGVNNSAHWDTETDAKNRAVREEFDRRWAERHNGRPRMRALAKTGFNSGASIEVPVSPAIATKLQAVPPVCRVTGTFQTKRLVILDRAPLSAGMSMAKDGRVSLVTFERQNREIKQPGQLGARYTGMLVATRPLLSEQRTFFLVDRVHRTLGGGLGQHIIISVAPVGVWVSAHVINLDPPTLWRTDRWVEVPDWQKDCDLVVEESRPANSYHGKLVNDRLEFTELVTE